MNRKTKIVRKNIEDEKQSRRKKITKQREKDVSKEI